VPADLDLVEKRSVVPAVVLGGVALVAAGVGGALLAVSGGKKDSAIELLGGVRGTGTTPCSANNLTGSIQSKCDEFTSTARSVDKFHDAAIGLFVGAGVAGAAAVVYLLLPPPVVKKTPVRGLRATPIVGSGRTGFLLSGDF
jgi:hypothetical protein